MSKTKIARQSFTEFIPSLKTTDQFTVYERKEYVRRSVPYNRRDFYKISLTLSTGNLYYADKGVNVDRPALIFSNPIIPYAWEGICDSQEGFFCLFTEGFLKGNERESGLQDSPFFKIGTDPIFFVNEPKLAYITSIFQNMLRE